MTHLRQIAVSVAGSALLGFGLAGCAPETPEPVSPKAMLETSGDKIITWSAPAAGQLTVVDQNTKKIVYGSKVSSGQAVKVDVDANRITVDNQTVTENLLHGGDQYRIFFEPSSTVEKTSTVETNSVETVHEH